jgi:hypothetical protein
MLLQLFLLSSISLPSVLSQFINGQFFSPGLGIIDSPAANTPFHAGSTLPIAIDISGDGALPWPYPNDPQDQATIILNMTVFMISEDKKVNITVQDEGVITQEPGSTVKHLNWMIPNCTPGSGDYQVSTTA